MEKFSQQDNVGVAILRGACNPKSTDLAVQLGERGLDSLMDEGVLKEIPLLKTILACKKTWEAIHDQLFLRKLVGFISAWPDFSKAERERFAKKHLKNAQLARRLGDGIVLILDKLDALEKPQLVAKLFAALVREQIDLTNFRRLAAAVDIGFFDDLIALTKHQVKHDEVPPDYLPNLLRTGLTEIYGPRERSREPGSGFPPPLRGTYYRVSELGEQFVKCMNAT